LFSAGAGAAPDQLEVGLPFDLDEVRKDRRGEARIIELERQVALIVFLAEFYPGGSRRRSWLRPYRAGALSEFRFSLGTSIALNVPFKITMWPLKVSFVSL